MPNRTLRAVLESTSRIEAVRECGVFGFGQCKFDGEIADAIAR